MRERASLPSNAGRPRTDGAPRGAGKRPADDIPTYSGISCVSGVNGPFFSDILQNRRWYYKWMIEFSTIVYHVSVMCNKVYRRHDLSPLTFTNTLRPINMGLNMSVIHCPSEVRDRMTEWHYSPPHPRPPPPPLWFGISKRTQCFLSYSCKTNLNYLTGGTIRLVLLSAARPKRTELSNFLLALCAAVPRQGSETRERLLVFFIPGEGGVKFSLS